ncbi:hypothetical protein HA402_012731 [Bradysia odoriphaga]|nr:hypothetical protein HA402_012731 [Bradysia odoriphaga]
MSGYRLFFLLAVSTTILCQCTYAGPVRSLALAAARAAKIPRSIRTPFRNTEMMTARGFGKRSQTSKFKDGDWNYGKRETKFMDEFGVDGDALDQIFNEQSSESFPIEWIANEMASNPMLAHTILHRFVDSNKDGLLSSHELLGGIGQSSSDSNDVY